MSKEKKAIQLSKHHLLPQSQWGANIARNIEVIREVQHRAIHTLFENKMIAEQLITTVNISWKALRPDIKQWLIDTLTSKDIYDPYERYDERVIK
jgi:hypothetical protein